MDTVSAIIRALGGPTRVAAALDISSPSTVVKWSARERIPGRYWLSVADLAAGASVQGASVERIAAMHQAVVAPFHTPTVEGRQP